MAETLDLNILGLSTQSLLVVLIVVLLLQCYGVLKCSEGLSTVDYDKYQAAYNQEQDNTLGATSSGDALNKKVVDSWGEGLVGGYEAPAFWDNSDYNMQQAKGDGGVVNTTRPIDAQTEGLASVTEGLASVTEGQTDPLNEILHGRA